MSNEDAVLYVLMDWFASVPQYDLSRTDAAALAEHILDTITTDDDGRDE